MNLANRTIAVIGLGYVGLPLAVEFGKKRPVIGFDIKADRIAELQAGHDHTLEVSVEELKEAKHLSFTANPALILLKQPPPVALGGSADAPPMVFIVTVPTPVDKANIPQTYADATKAKTQLHWTAQRTLTTMMQDAWHWQCQNPQGYSLVTSNAEEL